MSKPYSCKKHVMFVFFLVVSGASLASAETPRSFSSGILPIEEFTPLALEHCKMGPAYIPQPLKLVYDSEGRPWYLLDFLRAYNNSPGEMLGKRQAFDPRSGEAVNDSRILQDLGARISFEEAIQVAQKYAGFPISPKRGEGKLLLWDSMTRKVTFAVNYFDLPPGEAGQDTLSQQIQIELKQDSFERVWYVISLIRRDMEKKKSYLASRVVINPHDGSRVSDLEILSDIKARPDDPALNIIGSTKEVLSPKMVAFLYFLSILIVMAGCFLILWGLYVLFRKAGWMGVDIIMLFSVVILSIFTVYFFMEGKVLFGASMLSVLIYAVIMWAFFKMTMGMGLTGSDAFEVVPHKDLPQFSDVGGMDQVKKELRETVGLILGKGAAIRQYRVTFNGVLLYGLPGTGKSFLARATAGEFKMNFLRAKVSDLFGMYYGSSARNVDILFRKARKKAPCLLLLDEFDSLASERGIETVYMEDRRVLTHLLTVLEDVRKLGGKVVVFAATNNRNIMDPAAVRAGRFDKHIHIPLPDEEARKAIILAHLQHKPMRPGFDMAELVYKTNGMSAADIASVLDQSVLDQLSGTITEPAKQIELSNPVIAQTIQKFAQQRKPNLKKITWEDLILQEEVTQELKRFVKIIESPDLIRRSGIEPPKGILLYGPPGTGKTTIAKVIASQANASFFPILPSDVFSKWRGESERNVKKIFEEACRHKPAIIFFDEVDTMMSARGDISDHHSDKVTNLILQNIDGMQDVSNVFFIGATNAPDAVDPGLLRGGRLSVQFEIPLPGEKERERLFALYLKKCSLAPDIDILGLARMTDRYSGADIREICHRAVLDSLGPIAESTAERPPLVLDQEQLQISIQKYRKRLQKYKVPSHFKQMGF
ncbi:MAG: AAA family ATPase [Candidatus Omnitrophica bacterium]|nr:AAA family ATPase [Candidatus Omnitrophota bacterium]